MANLRVLKNSGIYTVCNFLTKGLSFILLPLYTAYLSTADYGITGLTDSFKNVMSVLCIFSLHMAVMRFFFDYRDDVRDLKRYVGTLFCFSFLSSLVWGIGFCLLQQWLMPVLFQGIDFWPTMAITLVGLVFGTSYTIYQNLLRSMERARASVVMSLANFLVTAILTIVMIVPLEMGANGVLLASTVTSVLFLGLAVADLSRRGMFCFCIDFRMLKEMLVYSVPLMPHNLSSQIASLVSSVLINGQGSLSTVGLYSLASKFGVIADTLQSSVNSAYQPWLFGQMKERKKGFKREIVSFTESLLWIYAAVFVAVGLFIQELTILFLDASYIEAWPLIPLIIGVYSIKTVYYFYIGVLFYYKVATKFIFIATLSSSVLNVLLSFAFVPVWGAYGSVAADAVAMVLRVAIVIVISRRYEDIGYRLWQFARVTLSVWATLAVGLAFSYTRYLTVLSFENLAWKLGVYMVFLVVVCLTHKRTLRKVAEVLRRRRRGR